MNESMDQAGVSARTLGSASVVETGVEAEVVVNRHGEKYTQEEKAHYRELYLQGKTLAQIAEALGRTHKSVIGQRRVLSDLPSRKPCQTVLPLDVVDRIIEMRVGGMAERAIIRTLGISPRGCARVIENISVPMVAPVAPRIERVIYGSEPLAAGHSISWGAISDAPWCSR